MLGHQRGEIFEVFASSLEEQGLEDFAIGQVLTSVRSKLPKQDSVEIEELHNATQNCKKCPNLQRNPYLPYWNHDDPEVLFVADSPPAYWTKEDLGILLETLSEVGFHSSDVCLTFLTRCPPPEFRHPVDEEISNCSNYLNYEIDIMSPKVIVSLGLNVAESLGVSSGVLKDDRQDIHWMGSFPVLCTYSPGYVSKASAGIRNGFERDMLKVRHFCDGKV